MTDGFVFGYGSLVNRRTHGFSDAVQARVKGWRRAWRRSPLRSVCYLTVVPDQAAEILGLVAAVPGGDWAALDEREAAYRRHAVRAVTDADAPQATIYAIPQGQHFAPGAENPVLWSYIETVVQGFWDEFGADGVAHFFATTDGWRQAPVIDDRDAPIYRNHQPADPDTREMVAEGLGSAGARVISGPIATGTARPVSNSLTPRR